MKTVTYRIEYTPTIHLPYRIWRRVSGESDTVVRSFEYQGDAEDVLDILRQETEALVKELSEAWQDNRRLEQRLQELRGDYHNE